MNLYCVISGQTELGPKDAPFLVGPVLCKQEIDISWILVLVLGSPLGMLGLQVWTALLATTAQ